MNNIITYIMKICKTCGNELTKTQKLYCSISCKTRGHYIEKVKNRNTSYTQFKKADIRKKQFIKEFGGGCFNCGYNKNYSALQFHHIKEKLFSLDSRNIGNRSLESLRSELSTCILLCANCHAEHHNPQCTLVDTQGIEP